MTEREREMLLGKAPLGEDGTKKLRRRGGWLKKLLIGVVSVIVALTLVVWLGGPSIAGWLTPRETVVDVGGRDGKLLIGDVSFSWGGPQKAMGVKLIDADGQMMADLAIEATTGLISALRTGDLGTLSLSGTLDVREAQVQQIAMATPKAPKPGQPGALAGTGGGAPAPLILPTWYQAKLETSGLNVRYVTASGESYAISGLDVLVSYGRGETLTLTAKSQSPAMSLNVSATKLTNAKGELAPMSAEVDISSSATLPGALVDSLVRAAMGAAGSSGAPTAETRFAAAAQVRGGRLTLLKGQPIIIHTPIPGPVLAKLEDAETGLRITQAPVLTAIVRSLDLPLVAALGMDGTGASAANLDLRGSGFVIDLKATAAAAQVAIVPGEGLKDVVIEPWQLTLSAEDFAKGLDAETVTRVLVNGAPAGTVALKAKARELLDGAGVLRAVPGDVNAEFHVKGAPTALAEAFVADRGFTLREVVGANLDLLLTVQTKRLEAAIPGTTPKPAAPGSVEITTRVESEQLLAWTVLVSDGARVWSEGRGAMVQLSNPGPAVRAALKDSGIEMSGEGLVLVELHDLDVALVGGLPDLSRAKGSLRTAVGDVIITKGAGSRPLEVTSIHTNVEIGVGPEVSVAIDHRLKSDGKLTRAEGTMALAGLARKKTGGFPWVELTLDDLRPAGTIHITGIPSDALGLVGEPWSQMAREALGGDVSAELTSPSGAGSGVARSAILKVHSAGVQIETTATLRDRTLSIGPTRGTARVTPELISMAAMVAPEMETPLPQLEKAATIELSVLPLLVSLNEQWQPDMNTLRPANVMVSVRDDLVLSGVALGPEGALGKVGLRGLTIGAGYDFDDPIKSEGSVRTTLFDPADASASVAEIEVISNLIMPPPAMNATISKVDTARLDRMLMRPGLTRDALGDELGLRVVGAAPGDGRPVVYELTAVSPKLSTKGSLVKKADRLELAAPLALQWEAPAEWLNAHAMAPSIAGESDRAISFVAPVAVRMDVTSLVIGMPGALTPGVFAVDSKVTTPAARLVTNTGDRVNFEGVAATFKKDAASADARFSLTAARQSVQQKEGDAAIVSTDPFRVEGTLQNFASASGDFDSTSAALSANVSGSAPTALLDAIGRTKGLLFDTLGPNSGVIISAKNLSQGAGSLDVVAKTTFANASIAGDVRDGALVTSGSPSVTLRQISPELSKRVFEQAFPMLARFQKTEKDEPATVRAQGLVIPMDGDLSKLNGRVSMDMGTVVFETSTLFGELLKFTGQRASGQMGKKVKPFDFTLTNGVVKYERIEVPVGEFTIVMRGEVNLVKRKMDIVTFVPALAMADDVLKLSRVAPGLTMIPIRTKGSFDDAKSSVALELILEEGVPGAVGGAAGGAAEGVGGIITGIGGLLQDAVRKQEEEKRKKEEKKQRKREAKEAQESESPPQ